MTVEQTLSWLRTRPWISAGYEAPADAMTAVGMLNRHERKMLPWLGERYYTGAGKIVELGTFLGASTVGLASGLDRNTAIEFSVKDKAIHAFDGFHGRFERRWIRTRAPKTVLDADGGFYGAYCANIQGYSHLVEVHRGDILEADWPHLPIEILFVDLAKTSHSADKVVTTFFPHLIPGRSVVVMQDYLNRHGECFNAVVMEHYRQYFERAGDTETNSVLFLYTEAIPAERVSAFSWDCIPVDEKIRYLRNVVEDQPFLHQREVILEQVAALQGGRNPS